MMGVRWQRVVPGRGNTQLQAVRPEDENRKWSTVAGIEGVVESKVPEKMGPDTQLPVTWSRATGRSHLVGKVPPSFTR